MENEEKTAVVSFNRMTVIVGQFYNWAERQASLLEMRDFGSVFAGVTGEMIHPLSRKDAALCSLGVALGIHEPLVENLYKG
jgi:hypothetical protein